MKVSSQYFFWVYSYNVLLDFYIFLRFRRQGYTELKVLDWSVQEDQETFPLSDTVKNIPRPRRRKIADPFVSGLIVDKTLQQIISELPLPENETEEGSQAQYPFSFAIHDSHVITTSFVTR